MSRAFVKEGDGEGDVLPDLLISPHPNYVTAEGLALMEQRLAELQAALAQSAGDRSARAAVERDLRYWRVRRASAELIPKPVSLTAVRFGTIVTIARSDGGEQTWRIVGEDEADPNNGTLSYVTPLARMLLGKEVGDVLTIGGVEAEVISIS